MDDDLDGSASEYFYKFTAGPGKLTVTFEVKASGTNAGATLDLFDARSRPLLSDVLVQGVDGGSERVVKSVEVRGKQDLLMRIKGVRYGESGGTGTYKVMLDGPVNPGPGAPPDAGGAPAAPAGGGAAAPAGGNLVSGKLDPADERVLFHLVNIDAPPASNFCLQRQSDRRQGWSKIRGARAQGNLSFSGPRGAGRRKHFEAHNLRQGQDNYHPGPTNKFPDNGGRGTYSVHSAARSLL